MIAEDISEGCVVYRFAQSQRWKRIKWQEQAKNDVILRIWYNLGDIESIQCYVVTESPDMTKPGCPVMCETASLP
jgi:hypothetical protein